MAARKLDRPFYPMFLDLRDKGLSATAKQLYGMIKFRSDGNDVWITSMEHVKDELECSRDTAVRCAGALKALHLIDFETIAGGPSGGETKFIILDGNTRPIPSLFNEKPREPFPQNSGTVREKRSRKISERSGRPLPQNSRTVEGGVAAKLVNASAKLVNGHDIPICKTELSKNVDVDALRVRLIAHGLTDEDFERKLRQHSPHEMEIAEAIVNQTAEGAGIKTEWHRAFFDALSKGYPRSGKLLTYTEKLAEGQLARSAREKRSRDAREAAAIAQAIDAWADSIGFDRLSQLLESVPTKERREKGLRSLGSAHVREYLYELHHRNGKASK